MEKNIGRKRSEEIKSEHTLLLELQLYKFWPNNLKFGYASIRVHAGAIGTGSGSYDPCRFELSPVVKIETVITAGFKLNQCQ